MHKTQIEDTKISVAVSQENIDDGNPLLAIADSLLEEYIKQHAHEIKLHHVEELLKSLINKNQEWLVTVITLKYFRENLGFPDLCVNLFNYCIGENFFYGKVFLQALFLNAKQKKELLLSKILTLPIIELIAVLFPENLKAMMTLRDQHQRSDLHIAAANSENLAFARKLISCGADVNAVTQNNETPTMVALYFGQTEMYELLVASGGKYIQSLSFSPNQFPNALFYAIHILECKQHELRKLQGARLEVAFNEIASYYAMIKRLLATSTPEKIVQGNNANKSVLDILIEHNHANLLSMTLKIHPSLLRSTPLIRAVNSKISATGSTAINPQGHNIPQQLQCVKLLMVAVFPNGFRLSDLTENNKNSLFKSSSRLNDPLLEDNFLLELYAELNSQDAIVEEKESFLVLIEQRFFGRMHEMAAGLKQLCLKENIGNDGREKVANAINVLTSRVEKNASPALCNVRENSGKSFGLSWEILSFIEEIPSSYNRVILEKVAATFGLDSVIIYMVNANPIDLDLLSELQEFLKDKESDYPGFSNGEIKRSLRYCLLSKEITVTTELFAGIKKELLRFSHSENTTRYMARIKKVKDAANDWRILDAEMAGLVQEISLIPNADKLLEEFRFILKYLLMTEDEVILKALICHLSAPEVPDLVAGSLLVEMLDYTLTLQEMRVNKETDPDFEVRMVKELEKVIAVREPCFHFLDDSIRQIQYFWQVFKRSKDRRIQAFLLTLHVDKIALKNNNLFLASYEHSYLTKILQEIQSQPQTEELDVISANLTRIFGLPQVVRYILEGDDINRKSTVIKAIVNEMVKSKNFFAEIDEDSIRQCLSILDQYELKLVLENYLKNPTASRFNVLSYCLMESRFSLDEILTNFLIDSPDLMLGLYGSLSKAQRQSLSVPTLQLLAQQPKLVSDRGFRQSVLNRDDVGLISDENYLRLIGEGFKKAENLALYKKTANDRPHLTVRMAEQFGGSDWLVMLIRGNNSSLALPLAKKWSVNDFTDHQVARLYERGDLASFVGLIDFLSGLEKTEQNQFVSRLIKLKQFPLDDFFLALKIYEESKTKQDTLLQQAYAQVGNVSALSKNTRLFLMGRHLELALLDQTCMLMLSFLHIREETIRTILSKVIRSLSFDTLSHATREAIFSRAKNDSEWFALCRENNPSLLTELGMTSFNMSLPQHYLEYLLASARAKNDLPFLARYFPSKITRTFMSNRKLNLIDLLEAVDNAFLQYGPFDVCFADDLGRDLYIYAGNNHSLIKSEHFKKIIIDFLIANARAQFAQITEVSVATATQFPNHHFFIETANRLLSDIMASYQTYEVAPSAQLNTDEMSVAIDDFLEKWNKLLVFLIANDDELAESLSAKFLVYPGFLLNRTPMPEHVAGAQKLIQWANRNGLLIDHYGSTVTNMVLKSLTSGPERDQIQAILDFSDIDIFIEQSLNIKDYDDQDEFITFQRYTLMTIKNIYKELKLPVPINLADMLVFGRLRDESTSRHVSFYASFKLYDDLVDVNIYSGKLSPFFTNIAARVDASKSNFGLVKWPNNINGKSPIQALLEREFSINDSLDFRVHEITKKRWLFLIKTMLRNACVGLKTDPVLTGFIISKISDPTLAVIFNSAFDYYAQFIFNPLPNDYQKRLLQQAKLITLNNGLNMEDMIKAAIIRVKENPLKLRKITPLYSQQSASPPITSPASGPSTPTYGSERSSPISSYFNGKPLF